MMIDTHYYEGRRMIDILDAGRSMIDTQINDEGGEKSGIYIQDAETVVRAQRDMIGSYTRKKMRQINTKEDAKQERI